MHPALNGMASHVTGVVCVHMHMHMCKGLLCSTIHMHIIRRVLDKSQELLRPRSRLI